MTAQETAGRPGKGEDGRGRTREVKLAVFLTRDELDKDGYPVRDPGSSSYLATFEPARVFADLVEAEGNTPRRSWSPTKWTRTPGFGVLRAFVVSPWQDQTRPEPRQGVAAPICSTLTCTSIRDSRVPAARTATSSTFRRGRCARACACSEPETSPIRRGRPSCGKPWSRQSPACSGSGRSWKDGSFAIPRLPAQTPSASCSPSRSPRSTGAGSAPGKSITLFTRRASTPRTGSPRRWPRSATWHRTAGRFSAWILVICWTSRYRPIPAAFSSRPTSGLRGSPSSAQNPASTRSRNATPTWPSTYSRWRPACPRIRR